MMVAMWGCTMGIIVIQRDLGAALLLFGIFLAMLYVATGKGWYALVGLLAFAVGAYGCTRSSGEVQDRVAIWLIPGTTATVIRSSKASMAGCRRQSLAPDWDRVRPQWFQQSITGFVHGHCRRARLSWRDRRVLLLYLLLMNRGYHIALRLTSRFRGFEQLLAIGLSLDHRDPDLGHLLAATCALFRSPA